MEGREPRPGGEGPRPSRKGRGGRRELRGRARAGRARARPEEGLEEGEERAPRETRLGRGRSRGPNTANIVILSILGVGVLAIIVVAAVAGGGKKPRRPAQQEEAARVYSADAAGPGLAATSPAAPAAVAPVPAAPAAPTPAPTPPEEPAGPGKPPVVSLKGKFDTRDATEPSDERETEALCPKCKSVVPELAEKCPRCRQPLDWSGEFDCPFCFKKPGSATCAFCGGAEPKRAAGGIVINCPVCDGKKKCTRCEGSGKLSFK
jgi:hypothetical protein